jgi:hypothetical protein
MRLRDYGVTVMLTLFDALTAFIVTVRFSTTGVLTVTEGAVKYTVDDVVPDKVTAVPDVCVQR